MKRLAGPIPNRVGIEHRPPTVVGKQEIGHWEGDTLIGKDHHGVLLTPVERVTKYTLLVKLPSKEATPSVISAASTGQEGYGGESRYMKKGWRSRSGPPLRGPASATTTAPAFFK